MTKVIALLLSYCCFLLPLSGQSSAADLVRDFAARPELRGAAVSISVVEIGSGRSVADHRAEIAAIPASVTKLITTAAAHDILGPAYTFRTRLILEGRVHAGTLRGNLHIVGGGDPTLASPYMSGVIRRGDLLDRWVNAVRKRGIQRIEGQVIGDGNYYGTDGAGFAWPWSDLGNYYGAGAYGLNWHENFYFLDLVQRQTVGAQPLLRGTRPTVQGLTLINELVSGPRGSGDQAYIYGAPFNYQHYIRGSIPVGTSRFTIKGSLPDPALFAAQELNDRLSSGGIVTSSPAFPARIGSVGDYRQGQVIDELVSPPLTAILERTNMRSNNLYAETLLREMNKARGATRATLAGTEVITNWLYEQGLNVGGVQLEDGSGLSPRNFFSAAFMTDFLLSQADRTQWRATIPVAGRSGAMRRALKGTVADGRVAAKSGSLDAVRAYAGYIRRTDGQELAFAIMVNNYTAEGSRVRAAMLGLMRDLVTAPL